MKTTNFIMSVLYMISTIFFLVLFNNGYKARFSTEALSMAIAFSCASLFLSRFYYMQFRDAIDKETEEKKKKEKDF